MSFCRNKSEAQRRNDGNFVKYKTKKICRGNLPVNGLLKTDFSFRICHYGIRKSLGNLYNFLIQSIWRQMCTNVKGEVSFSIFWVGVPDLIALKPLV